MSDPWANFMTQPSPIAPIPNTNVAAGIGSEFSAQNAFNSPAPFGAAATTPAFDPFSQGSLIQNSAAKPVLGLDSHTLPP